MMDILQDGVSLIMGVILVFLILACIARAPGAAVSASHIRRQRIDVIDPPKRWPDRGQYTIVVNDGRKGMSIPDDPCTACGQSRNHQGMGDCTCIKIGDVVFYPHDGDIEIGEGRK